ncbi:MAG TPA: hypothetical protein VHF26_05660 [Trebonia sp.]|nr:hypothetical protein [Trebonia sp.]
MTWTAWQPPPEAEDPSHGGMTQLAAYHAGLTDDPGCWARKLELYWDPRLDPGSPEYDPQLAAEVAWEEPSPAEAQALDAQHQPDTQPQPGPEPDGPEPEAGF